MNINEIAKLSGVSRATVSRYLNNGYVSEDKKQKIQQVIDETGYKPSSFAQTLRSKKTHLIGVIIPKINSDSISRLVSGISKILNAKGFELLLSCTENHSEKELEYLSIFRDNKVDGIILLGTIFTPAHMEALEKLSVPIVIIGQDIAGYPCVFHDDYNATRELTKRLLDTAREIGYLQAPIDDIAVGYNRLEGFRAALESVEFPADMTHIYECQFSVESGYERAKLLLEEHPTIDTIICATDSLAIGAFIFLKEQHINIPDQIQIAGLNDSTMARLSDPQLTTVHFYYEQSGEKAANILLSIIDKKAQVSKNPSTPIRFHSTASEKLGFSLIIKPSIRL